MFPGRIRKVETRVVSIGNITWGGTGKTPLTTLLAKVALKTGKKAVILTRGYGRDEVKGFEKHLPGVPVLIGRDRIASARKAVKEHNAEIILLDDGFQHIRLSRDLDIVNINATQPFGPGGLIPLGTLREPLENLSRANVFVITKSDIGAKNVHWIRQKLKELNPTAAIFEARHRPVQFMDFRRNRFLPLEEVHGKRVATICAIADPFSFEKTVERLHTDIPLAARFDDHHWFTESEIKDFLKKTRQMQIKDIVTTEKDYYRLERHLKRRRSGDFTNVNLLVLQIEFEVQEEEDFLVKCFGNLYEQFAAAEPAQEATRETAQDTAAR